MQLSHNIVNLHAKKFYVFVSYSVQANERQAMTSFFICLIPLKVNHVPVCLNILRVFTVHWLKCAHFHKYIMHMHE